MPVTSFNIKILAKRLESNFPEVLFAFLFGSARNGKILTGSDIDLSIYIAETADKTELIMRILKLMELSVPSAGCDLTILNTAEPLVAFEALSGHLLFIRKKFTDIYAGFYSHICRLYEDQICQMKKQLEYRGYEVQWDY
jgi:predicted nucleotidyltransferase